MIKIEPTMRSILYFALLISFLIFPIFAWATENNPLPDTYKEVGQGCTNAFYIDRDCDGYGVGAAWVLGPDADDTVDTINTSKSVAGMETFLSTTKGYAPTSEWLFVDPVGYDGSPTKSTDYNIAEGNPYKTVMSAIGEAGVGDTIVVKAGTYSENFYVDSSADGTSGNPIVLVAYPGHSVVFNPNINMSFQNRDYWVIDGIEFNLLSRQMFSFGKSTNLAIRNCEFHHGSATYGVVFGHNHQYLTFEYNYIHDNKVGGEHIMYIGSNYWASWESHDWTIKGNLFRSNPNEPNSGDNLQINNFHWNTNTITIEDNVFAASSEWAAITLYRVTDCIIQNNVFLGPHKKIIIVRDYWDAGGRNPRYDSNGLTKNVKIINNRILLTQHSYDGQTAGNHAVFLIQDDFNWSPSTWQSSTYYGTIGQTVSPSSPNGYIYASGGACTSGVSEPTWPTTPHDSVSDGSCTWYALRITTDLNTGNVIRNNAIYAYNHPVFIIRDSKYYDGTTADSWAIDNNKMYVSSGDFALLGGAGKTFAQFEAIDDGRTYEGISNNDNSDPLFAAIDNVYSTPESKDLRLQSDNGIPPVNSPPSRPTGLRIASNDSAQFTKIIDKGDSSTHLDLVFISSGFTSGEINDYKDKVTGNINKMFSVNWFDHNRELFNIWRIDYVSSQSGQELDENTVWSLASSVPYDIVVVIHNKYGQEEQHRGYAELVTNSHNYVVLAHELGHLIGYLADEYYYNPISTCYSKQTLNIHDKPSNEKWAELIGSPPFEGGNYCDEGLWRPSENSIMLDSAHGIAFNAVGLYAMDKGAGKLLGTIESTGPNIQITGISNNATKSGLFAVTVNTSDVSGIERVEFYVRPEGGLSRSIKIDNPTGASSPYESICTIDTTQYSNGKYDLFIYSYDKQWNYSGSQIIFHIDNS
jgi:hypothetical protein